MSATSLTASKNYNPVMAVFAPTTYGTKACGGGGGAGAGSGLEQFQSDPAVTAESDLRNERRSDSIWAQL